MFYWNKVLGGSVIPHSKLNHSYFSTEIPTRICGFSCWLWIIVMRHNSLVVCQLNILFTSSVAKMKVWSKTNDLMLLNILKFVCCITRKTALMTWRVKAFTLASSEFSSYFAISSILPTLVSWHLPDNVLAFSKSYLFVVSEQYSVMRCGHLKVGKNSSGNSWDLRQNAMINQQVIYQQLPKQQTMYKISIY